MLNILHINEIEGSRNEDYHETIKQVLTKLETNQGSRFLDSDLSHNTQCWTDRKYVNYILKENREEKHFQIYKADITFDGELCIAFIIKDMTTDFLLKKQEAKAKYERKVLASVTHDLRTPINGVMGILRILFEKIHDVELKNLIEIAMKSAEMLNFLIRDILDISQIESNTLRLNPNSVDIRKIANDCLKLIENDFKAKEVQLSLSISREVPESIITDEFRYKQILINLISNAFKYTPKGGFVKVKLKLQEEENLLLSEVEDTGLGIKSADLQKLFKAYGKIDDPGNLNPHSVGLGLNISKKLSKKLGGKIGVHSIYKKGSTFFFTISTILNSASSIQKSNSINILSQELDSHLFPHLSINCTVNDQISCECPKILLVDDVPTNLMVLENYLISISNISSEKAMNGKEALVLMEKRWKLSCCGYYFMIMMDINMPILDGIEATKRIRIVEKEKSLKKSIVIACTANNINESEEQIKYLKAGFNDIKAKPISKDETISVLKKFNAIPKFVK